MSFPQYCTFPADNLRAARVRASILRAFRTLGNANGTLLEITQDSGPPNSTAYTPASDFSPAAFLAVYPTFNLVFIDGITTQSQAALIVNGYTGPYINVLGTQFQPWFVGAAQRILDRLITPNAPFARTTYIAGFSAGGATGLWLAKKLLAALGTWSPRLTVFASPKAGRTNDYPIPSVLPYCHWFNVDDAVPFVPPTLSNMSRIFLGLSNAQAQSMAGFNQFRFGCQVGLVGQLVPAVLPAGTGVPQSDAVAAWLLQEEQGIQTPHSLEVLISRLDLAIAATSDTDSVGGGGDGFDPFQPPPLAAVIAARAAVVQTAFVDARRQNAVPVIIPNDLAFKAVKKGKVWSVMFNGNTIAVAPFKRRARALANAGNELLRKLQNEGIVNAGTLTQAWEEYLIAALDPANGFQPPMNIQP